MMKNCVMTRTFSCDPSRVWLYMTNPMMNHWRKDVTSADISTDGMQVTETASDGSKTEITFTEKEKPRRMTEQLASMARSRGSFYCHPVRRR